MAKISESKKVQLLEEAVLKNNPDEVEALFKEHKVFEFTARALGLACRFCGAEMVNLLLQNKASFKYEETTAFVKKYDCKIKLSNQNSIQRQYELWVLPGTKVEGYNYSIISDEERTEVLRVLEENKAGDLLEILYYAILYNDQISVSCLNELGIKELSEWRTSMISGNQGYLNWFIWKTLRQEEFQDKLATADKKELLVMLNNYLNAMPVDKIILFPADLVHFVWGKGEVSILNRYCSVELFDFFAKNTNLLERAKKWDILENLVKENNAAGIGFVLSDVWKLNKKETDELLNLAKETASGNPELVGYIIDYKKKMFGEADSAITKKLVLNDAPPSAAELKKQWGIKKLGDGTLRITSYKGDQLEVHIPELIGKNKVSEIDKDTFNPEAQRITPIQKKTRENITLVEFPGSIKEIPDKILARGSSYNIFSQKNDKEETKLTTIILNNGVEKIGKKAFSNAKNLSEVLIPDSVKEIGESAFYGCSELKEVRLPSGLSKYAPRLLAKTGLIKFNMPDNVAECGWGLFEDCESLEDITISKGLTKISSCMFMNCKNLKSITIPDSISVIEQDAFSGSGLEKCIVPISTKEIQSYVFRNCKSLKTVKISESTLVGDGCFEGCENLILEENDLGAIVYRGVLHGHKKAVWDSYCEENAILPASVKKISDNLWKQLPDIVYCLNKEASIEETSNLGSVRVGDEVIFGRFPESISCIPCPLKWKVLSVEDGAALLITKKAIISVNHVSFYNDMGTWDKSKLRKWLNKSFLEAAFTEIEQKLIRKASLTAPKNPFTKKDGGKDTVDSVFLLSYEEVEKYMPTNEERSTEMTEYARAHHPELNGKFKDEIYWETRTIGGKDGRGSIAINHTGEGYCNGTHHGYYTLRPAIWVNIEG